MSSIKTFNKQWAIILGGSSGFGLATVKKLASHGMHIAVLYRELSKRDSALKEELKQLALSHHIKILPFNLNALDKAKIDKFITEFNLIKSDDEVVKVILHSIARGNLKPLYNQSANEHEVLTTEDIEGTTFAMGTSLLIWVRKLLQSGLIGRDTNVLALISEGVDKYWESYAAVSIAKSTLVSLSKYMAVEFGKLGIRTNLIQAGITQTPSFKMIKGSDELATFAEDRNPLGRLTQTQDVANVVYLLCQPEASWINGSIIYVDGGEHCL